MNLTDPLTDPRLWALPLIALFLLVDLLGSLMGFFRAFGISRGFSNPETVEQLRLTLIHPQEMAFGFLWGAVLPMSLVVACAVPGVAIMGVELYLRGASLGPLEILVPMALPLIIWPWVFGGMMASGAIATAFSFGQSGALSPLVRSLVAWSAFQVFLILPCTLLVLASGPLGFVLPAPFVVLLRLMIAGGMLQYLAQRLSEDDGRG
jgi:hypothetical protein